MWLTSRCTPSLRVLQWVAPSDGARRVASRIRASSSGVSTVAIVIWLAAWWVGHRMWKGKSLSLGKVNALAFTLLALGLLLTFPPFEDLVIGK